jgi:hypothetical protein
MYLDIVDICDYVRVENVVWLIVLYLLSTNLISKQTYNGEGRYQKGWIRKRVGENKGTKRTIRKDV